MLKRTRTLLSTKAHFCQTKDTSVIRFLIFPLCNFVCFEKDSSVFQKDSSVLNLGSTQNVEISSVFYGIRNTLICPSQNVRCLLLVVIEDNILNSNNHVSMKTKSIARVFFFSLIISLYQERPRCCSCFDEK